MIIAGAPSANLARATKTVDAAAMSANQVDHVDENPPLAFTDVPAAAQEAAVDLHWLALRGDSLLPTLYMPPTMAGRRSPAMRLLATVLIAVFLLATVLGICLTYGPPNQIF
jgi:hypothetical protein